MPTWSNREYREIEEKTHGLYPAYLFYIEDISRNINADETSILIFITELETHKEFQVELVGGVQSKDILLLLTRYMSQREIIANPLPFDDLPQVVNSRVVTYEINNVFSESFKGKHE